MSETWRTIRRCGNGWKQCPLRWEALAPTGYEPVRSCGVCDRFVYFCASDEETVDRAYAGHCIAREEPGPDALGSHGIFEKSSEEQLRARAWRTREHGIREAIALDLSRPIRACPRCRYPVPSWRLTCYVCMHLVGRERAAQRLQAAVEVVDFGILCPGDEVQPASPQLGRSVALGPTLLDCPWQFVVVEVSVGEAPATRDVLVNAFPARTFEVLLTVRRQVAQRVPAGPVSCLTWDAQGTDRILGAPGVDTARLAFAAAAFHAWGRLDGDEPRSVTVNGNEFEVWVNLATQPPWSAKLSSVGYDLPRP